MAQRAPLARYFFIASVVETTGKPQARARRDALGPCLARSPSPAAARDAARVRMRRRAGGLQPSLRGGAARLLPLCSVLTCFGCAASPPRFALRRCSTASNCRPVPQTSTVRRGWATSASRCAAVHGRTRPLRPLRAQQTLGLAPAGTHAAAPAHALQRTAARTRLAPTARGMRLRLRHRAAACARTAAGMLLALLGPKPRPQPPADAHARRRAPSRRRSMPRSGVPLRG